jgi:hypothetical protein
MFTRGYAKHPCTQLACGQGFAVGTSQRYGRKEPSFRELAQKLPHNLGCIYVGGII